MNVFLGLNASAEELGLKRQNCWAFTTNNIDQDGLDYFNMDVDQVSFKAGNSLEAFLKTLLSLISSSFMYVIM